ncbi:unnamed protein product [Meloidogyne enterolobii]|uniref:Uncharacterized protein n=1 Tax=Meloidogyne enterolobii TaxID=390850 RepID=A0ACB1B329_MELEN
MMGQDVPTTTCVSSATSSNISQQQTNFVGAFSNIDSSNDLIKENEQNKQSATTTSSISSHSSTFLQTTSNVDYLGQQQQDDINSDNFPEDLNGLDGISPIGDLSLAANVIGPNSGGKCNSKVEFFGFVPTSIANPASANGHQHLQQQQNINSQQNLQQQQFNGPGSAPAGPSCCSSADSGHHSAGGSVSGGTTTGFDYFRRPSSSSSSNVLNQNTDQQRLQQQKIIIRDPFAPDLPPTTSSQFSNLSPLNGHQQHFNDQQQQLMQPTMQPLNWDGKPPADSKSMAELARLGSTDPSRPPLLPLPNVKEGGIPPGGVFPQWSFYNMPLRQRLEQLYPEGTFAPMGRWSSMPMPMFRPVIPQARMVLMSVKPGVPVNPALIPPWLVGKIPPGFIPMVALPGPNGQAIPVPYNAILPPGMFPPPNLLPPQQLQPNNLSSVKQQCDANISLINSAMTPGAAPKPKKETAKQRKQREREEQLRKDQDMQQNQQTNFGRSPQMDGGGPGGGQDGSSPFFGHIQLQHQMLQGMQQDACFKVPGRSPPSIKRCTSSIPPSGPGSAPPPVNNCSTLAPMPDQRIHAKGLCFACQQEINQQRKAIQCTAISQGCNQLYHWDCSGLSSDAFAEFCKDFRLEWICQSCFNLKSKEQCLMLAC